MNHIQRQNYHDIPISEVNPTTHDICQLKYDGIWCAAHASMRTVTYYSRNGLVKRTDTCAIVPDGIYIGELMFGSEWAQDPLHKDKFYIFDCLEFNKTNISNQAYRLRYTTLQHSLNLSLHPDWFLVPNYPISEANNIWTLVVDPGFFEGMVFRNSNDPWDVTLLRAKKEVTIDLCIAGFTEGEGRLKGSLGALLCIRPKDSSQTITVGGGLSDSLRKKIWSNQSSFLGKTIRVTAKKVFKSGLLRHANFHSFHDDK